MSAHELPAGQAGRKARGQESVSCSWGIKAATSDRLEDSLDYSKIYEIVAAEMQIPSNLLEHVAGRIIRSAAAAYPQFGDICVRVSKACPPVDGECRWSRVSLSREEMGI